jgi:hypothetical protein
LFKHLGWDILIVTARSEKYRRQLDWWLADNNIHSDVAPFMRGAKDQRPDVKVKKDILDVIRQKWAVGIAVDDNPSVIDLWKREGIKTITVPGWIED